jgi:endonuclease G, mitochondrial
MIPENVIRQTELRFNSHQDVVKVIPAHDPTRISPLWADDADRVIARLERLGANPVQAKAILGGEPLEKIQHLDTFARIGIERLIGKNDLISISFLSRGLRAAKSVCRVEVGVLPSNQTDVYGTGFLISERVLLTNNHVLPHVMLAASSRVRFEYEESVDNQLNPGVVYDLLPDELFFTDPDLDFTVVAVKQTSVDGIYELRKYGWLPLYNTPDRHIKTEQVNIIQHPQGEKKQLALRENQITDRSDDFLIYKTDTTPGSSGAPVFNDAWEVVALHHSGVPQRNAEGHPLNRDGSLYQVGQDDSLIDWIANEGTRASRIYSVLQAMNFSGAAKTLIAQFLESKSPKIEEMVSMSQPTKPESVAENIELHPPQSSIQLRPPRAMLQDNGSVTWTIPLEVSVQIGKPIFGAQHNGLQSPPRVGTFNDDNAAQSNDAPEIKEALSTLEQFGKRKYYNQAQDLADREAYYQGIDSNATSSALFTALQKLLTQTHTNAPRYKPMVELYPWIDLHPNGKLQSIYSGEEFEPVAFIRAEFVKESLRLAREKTLRAKEALDFEFDLLETSLAFNCEHVVPQSWFRKLEPMRGDLHHLFACESGCNSFRSNTPYQDFSDFREAIRGKCGKSEGGGFEPESSQGKGAAARATLYFLVRYPGEINATQQELTPDKIPLLLEWHQSNPVTEYELHRNQAIFARQGNRNPFIDFPEWAEKVDLTKGLGK